MAEEMACARPSASRFIAGAKRDAGADEIGMEVGEGTEGGGVLLFGVAFRRES